MKSNKLFVLSINFSLMLPTYSKNEHLHKEVVENEYTSGQFK